MRCRYGSVVTIVLVHGNPETEAVWGPMLTELDRIRALTVELVERSVPQLLPAPPEDAVGQEQALYELLLRGVRASAVPSAAS